MSRLFSGNAGFDETLVLDPGAVTANGPYTYIFLWIPKLVFSGGIFQVRAAGSPLRSIQHESPAAYFFQGFTDAFTYTVDDPAIIAVGKDAGSAALRLHWYPYSSGTWSHQDGETFGDGAEADELWIGRAFGRMCGLFVAGAAYDSNLADLDIENAGYETGLAAWMATAPVALWPGNQSTASDPVLDLTGNGADQIGVIGELPPVSTEEPPGWSYETSTIRVGDSDRAGFLSSTSGTLYTPPADPADAGDVDVLFVQAGATIATPPTWALPAGASQVNNMATYGFIRPAQAGDVVNATLVASADGQQVGVSWVRLKGVGGLDVAVSAHVESAGQVSTFVQTGLLAQDAELVLVASLMQTGGTGSGAPTSPVWHDPFEPIPGASGPVGALGPSQLSAFVGRRLYSAQSSQEPSLTWTGQQGLRYIIALAFTPATPPQTILTVQNPEATDVGAGLARQLGNEWRSSVDGFVPALRFLASDNPPPLVTMQLWRTSDGTLLATRQISEPVPQQWNNATLTAPVPIVAGATYCVCYFYNAPGGSVVYDADLLTADLVNGDLTALAGRGVFSNGTDGTTYPASSWDGTYFADVLFESQPMPPPAVTPLGLTSSATATMRVDAGAATHGGFVSTAAAQQRFEVSAATFIGLSGGANTHQSGERGGRGVLGLVSTVTAIQVVSSQGRTAVALVSRAAAAKNLTTTGASVLGLVSRELPAVLGPIAGAARVRVTSPRPLLRVSSPR